MTNEEKISIFEMRKKGLGYKAIAVKLNKTRDGIRAYCQRHNLGGEGIFVTKNMEVGKAMVCMKCGLSIEQPTQGRPRRFCSEQCRRAWWCDNPDRKTLGSDAMYVLTCAHCGRQYESYGNKSRKFCSHECYIKSRFYKEEAIHAI